MSTFKACPGVEGLQYKTRERCVLGVITVPCPRVLICFALKCTYLVKRLTEFRHQMRSSDLLAYFSQCRLLNGISVHS